MDPTGYHRFMSDDNKSDHPKAPPATNRRRRSDGESPDTLIEMAVIPFFVEGEGEETGEHSNINTPTIAEMRAEELDFDDDDDDDTVVIETLDDDELDE